MSGTGTLPTVDAARNISQPEAERLWLHILERQGLGGGEKQRSVHDVANRSLGLHAARLPSPFATLLARVEDPSIAEKLFSGESTATRLVTVRSMRKTLHTLPEQIAGIAHTATRNFRERDARRLALNASVTPNELDRLVDAIRLLLFEAGALGHREIETTLSKFSGIPALSARVALKFAWEAGYVVYRNASAHWNRERRLFALAEDVSPYITTTGNQAEATSALVKLYFERYGPASIKDAMWWSGLSRTTILSGLMKSDRPIMSLSSPWCFDPLYAFEEHIPQVSAGHRHAVDFLAHEDVALKAYYQTRGRYLGSLPSEMAFNRIGEVLPTIVVQGRVVGLWRWITASRHVDWKLFTGLRSTQKLCALRADELTSALRARHDRG